MRNAAVAVSLVTLLGLVSSIGAAERDGGGKEEHGREGYSARLPIRTAEAEEPGGPADSFFAMHYGPVGANATQALLSGYADARAVPAGTEGLGGLWSELGPKPFHTDTPGYGHTTLVPGIPETTAGSVDLTALGWTTVAGRMTAIAVDPADSSGNTVWAGAAGGGVWLTRDGGAHWAPKTDGLPSLAIGALAVDPVTHSIFAGTGEANSAIENFYGTGVYRSKDAGATWQRASRNIRDVSVVSHIEIAGGRIFVSTNKGLFRSLDDGNSYEDVKLPTNEAGTAPAVNGPFANVVTDVRAKPGSPDEITAAIGWRNGKPDSPGNGLYRSTTGGAPGSFTRMTTSGFGAVSLTADPIGRISLAYASGPNEDHNILWAVIQDAGLLKNQLVSDVVAPASVKNTVLNGVYRSGDDGATWDMKATSQVLALAPGSGLLAENALFYGPGVGAWYNQYVNVDPSNPDVVIVGLEEIYQTTANANVAGVPALWTTIGRYWNVCLALNQAPPCDSLGGPYAGLTPHPDQHASGFATLPGGGVRLYVGNDGGMYSQDGTDAGFNNQSWRALNDTLGTAQPYYAVMGSDGTVYTGMQDNGTAKITPDGRAELVYSGDGFDVAVDPKDSNIAYEEYTYGLMSVTTDGGKNWSSYINPTLTGALFSTPFRMDPADANHLVIGAQEIYETVNGPNTTCNTDQNLQGLAHTDQLCDWRISYDLGTITEKVTDPQTGAQTDTDFGNVTSAISVRGPRVYVGFCAVCDIITTGKGDSSLFQNGIATNVKAGCTPATQAGTCWHKPAERNLPNRYITSIAQDPGDANTIYVTLAGYARKWYPPDKHGRRVGRGHLFVSHDAGETFQDASVNLPDVPANAVVVQGSHVFVGTDMGVYAGTTTGSRYVRLGNGLPNSPVLDLRTNPQGTKLVAATHGRGVWSYTIASTPVQKPVVRGVKQSRKPLAATGVASSSALALALLVVAAASGVALRKRTL